MDLRQSLVNMLQTLIKDMELVQHQGAGYYTCAPVAQRYNKLLKQAISLFDLDPALIETFDPIPEADPKDPSDKLKLLQSIRIECGQLITLLQSIEEEPSA
ncbi:MAG: hypothetical protein GWP08_17180 [Nitrospiraceae bacterium]|nr:hypothetical protein [Nitrospiraceae bacterium]